MLIVINFISLDHHQYIRGVAQGSDFAVGREDAEEGGGHVRQGGFAQGLPEGRCGRRLPDRRRDPRRMELGEHFNNLILRITKK